jgi:hypothetical protein
VGLNTAHQAKVVVELLELGPWIADPETRKRLELSMPVQKKPVSFEITDRIVGIDCRRPRWSSDSIYPRCLTASRSCAYGQKKHHIVDRFFPLPAPGRCCGKRRQKKGEGHVCTHGAGRLERSAV